jgi:hypothetical protein
MRGVIDGCWLPTQTESGCASAMGVLLIDVENSLPQIALGRPNCKRHWREVVAADWIARRGARRG